MALRRQVGLALGFVAVLVTADLPARAQQSLTWTSGAVGGGWYAICGGIAELMREHQRRYASNLCTKGKDLEIQQHLYVFFESVRNAGRRVRDIELCRLHLSFGLLDSAFNFPHVAQIVTQPSTVAGRQFLIEGSHLIHDGIQ